MRKLQAIYFLGFLMISFATFAQQVPLFTLLEAVRPTLNPAYAGNQGYSDLVLLTRQQWVGYEGAPVSYYLAANAPLRNRKSGIGVDFQRMNSGPFTQNGLFFSYSYGVDISERSTLSFGLRGGFNSYRILYSDMSVIDPGDPLFETDLTHKILPNFGTGLHYSYEAYFVDISLPRLLRNEFSPDRDQKQGQENREDRPFYFLSGTSMDLVEGITLQPSLGIWWVKGTPPLVDLRILARVKETFGLGMAYRLKSTFSAFLSYRVLENFTLAYAYEFPLNNDYQLTSGTHEIVLGLDFEFLNKKTQSPRSF